MSVNQNVPSVFPSVMRTVVPLVVGVILTALARIGVDFSSEVVTSVVTAVAAGAYYTLFRLLERFAPTGGKMERLFGLLLGFARPPVYPPSGTPASVDTVRPLGPPAA